MDEERRAEDTGDQGASDQRPVTVFEAQGMLIAQVIRGKLESAGVPAMLKFEPLGQLLGLTVDGLGKVEVQVPPQWVDDARELLEEDPSDVYVEHPEDEHDVEARDD